ncbi:MAG: hypothetical protein ACLQRH_15020 [Acidimicrobiales bacterium]
MRRGSYTTTKWVLACTTMVMVAASQAGSATGAVHLVSDQGAVHSASLPARADVVRGRFVTSVSLDSGVLNVVPAPEHDRPRVTGESAAQKIWASPVLLGRQEGPLGYGLITISLHVKGVARVFRLPAWVGFAKATDTASCPAERSVPTTNPSGTSLTALPSNGYAAVVIGAVSGSPAVSYTARSSVCTSVQAASLAKATEVLSVPWQLLSGPRTGSIRLRATLPPCGDLEGISSGGSAKAWTITVGAVVPDVLGRCGPTHSATQTVDLGPPGNPPGAPPSPVSASTLILHGPLGPVALALAPAS